MNEEGRHKLTWQSANVDRGKGTKSSKEAFPAKLFRILEEVEDTDMSSILGWLPHGRAFRVHNRKRFEEEILPRHFGMTLFASYQRQLNIYGFHWINEGPDKDGYYSEHFVRGRPELVAQIRRQTFKGNGRRSKALKPPNFYQIPLRQQDGAGPVSSLDAAFEGEKQSKEQHSVGAKKANGIEAEMEPPLPQSLVVAADQQQVTNEDAWTHDATPPFEEGPLQPEIQVVTSFGCKETDVFSTGSEQVSECLVWKPQPFEAEQQASNRGDESKALVVLWREGKAPTGRQGDNFPVVVSPLSATLAEAATPEFHFEDKNPFSEVGGTKTCCENLRWEDYHPSIPEEKSLIVGSPASVPSAAAATPEYQSEGQRPVQIDGLTKLFSEIMHRRGQQDPLLPIISALSHNSSTGLDLQHKDDTGSSILDWLEEFFAMKETEACAST